MTTPGTYGYNCILKVCLRERRKVRLREKENERRKEKGRKRETVNPRSDGGAVKPVILTKMCQDVSERKKERERKKKVMHRVGEERRELRSLSIWRPALYSLPLKTILLRIFRTPGRFGASIFLGSIARLSFDDRAARRFRLYQHPPVSAGRRHVQRTRKGLRKFTAWAL